jgi:hypothetical protein
MVNNPGAPLSASPPKADMDHVKLDVGFVPILLKNSVQRHAENFLAS